MLRNQSVLRKVGVRAFRTANRCEAKILASDSIEKVCGEIFKQKGHELVEMPGIKKDELIKVIGEYEGLVVRSGTKVTKEIIDAGVKLKIIGRAGTGVDNIDVRAATSKGLSSTFLMSHCIEYDCFTLALTLCRHLGGQYPRRKHNINWRIGYVSYIGTC